LGSLLFVETGQADPITWQVQADFSSTTTRSVRGIALSPDESNEYLGFIQGTSGSSAVSEYSSAVISPPTNPAATATITDNGRQPKGVAVDDRGNVYSTYGTNTGSTTQQFRIYTSTLGAVQATQNVTLPTSSQLGGMAVQNLGGTYYAYISSNKGSATIQRWNVTTPSTPTLDTSFGSGGTLNLQTLLGNANAFVNGLDVAPDGTIYATGGLLNVTNDRGDELFKINAAGTAVLAQTAVTEALDVALFSGQLYVAEYNGGASAIDVLNASDLSPVTVLTTPFVDSTAAGSDDGYAGITVNSAGQLYVTDEDYNGNTSTTPDRVLVSSTVVPEPASLGLLAVGGLALLAKRRRRA
jgi:hypothetical protein